MKNYETKLLVILALTFNVTIAQNFSISSEIVEAVDSNRDNTPCLTEAQRGDIHVLLIENKRQLLQEGKLIPINKAGGHPLFVWPLAQATGENYISNYYTRSYVDHDPAYPDQLQDYNCGTRTDDTVDGYNHQGVDIVPWPFWWHQMDENQAEIIAAEAGQIIGKFDGNYDRNCEVNTEMWNAIYIQHGDGSTSWYGHMKSGSLTSKDIGDTVEQGEFLGIVGSSGNSERPHLHFEVYDTDDNLVDPYFGDCNTMNPDSWWLDQKPYTDPKINFIATHNEYPIIGNCPNTEDILNIQDQFYGGDPIKFSVFFRDGTAGTQIEHLVKYPNGDQVAAWTNNLTQNYYGGQWWPGDGGTLPSNSIEGIYTYEVTYLGQTVIHPFIIGTLSVEDLKIRDTKVYPNPLQTTLFIESEATIVSADIKDVLGKTVLKTKDNSTHINDIEVSFLSKGIYFITLITDENKSKTIKLIKE